MQITVLTYTITECLQHYFFTYKLFAMQIACLHLTRNIINHSQSQKKKEKRLSHFCKKASNTLIQQFYRKNNPYRCSPSRGKEEEIKSSNLSSPRFYYRSLYRKRVRPFLSKSTSLIIFHTTRPNIILSKMRASLSPFNEQIS